jgi:hypothetical protein
VHKIERKVNWRSKYDGGEQSFYTPVALFPREAPPFPLDVRLPGAQSRAVCFGDEKISVPLPGISLRYVSLLASTSVGIELVYCGSVEFQMGI